MKGTEEQGSTGRDKEVREGTLPLYLTLYGVITL
jgi:hypothetical protein